MERGMETKEEIIQMLKSLFAVCRTSEISFRAAADSMDSETASQLLKSYADQRSEFAQELQAEIRFHSGSDYHATPTADSWIEIRQAIDAGDAQEIIQACERSEEAVVRVYKNALDRRIPWDVETVLAHQYSDIKQARYTLSALELFSNQFVV
jgi:uncharacterized protein (TIGR02284 family)